MVDHDFYLNKFGGSVASSTDFNRYLRRATVILNRFTFNHIVQIDGEYGQIVKGKFQAFTDDERESLQFGLCNLINKMSSLDAVEQQALSGNSDSGNVKSRTSGGESISYENRMTAYDEALTDESKKMALFRSALMEFAQPELFRVNPFFAGSR